MSKTELRDALQAKGLLEKTGSNDPLWRQAFDLHYRETKIKLQMSCGGCWNRVRNWLKS